MKMRRIIFIAVVALLGVITVINLVKPEHGNRVIKIGFPAHWGTIVPSLQHTAYAEAILANQFEPLVRIGHDGTIIPAAAKSWSISSDYRVFTFKVDTSKQFSNGTNLKAHHFKNAWEHGVKLAPKSSNSSLLDILYKVEGASSKSDDIKGLVVLDEETFQIHFKKPFRMALEHLTGIRMAAHLMDDEKYVGTGPYVILETGDNELTLTANTFHNPVPSIKKAVIMRKSADKASELLNNGEIDIYYFAQLASVEECLDESSKISCWMGQETHNATLALNGKPGTFFSNKKYRQALNYLVHSKLSTKTLPKYHRINKLKIDPQFYLPFQSGRLEGSEVSSYLNLGKKWIDEMIEATHKSPIRIITSEPVHWVQEMLEKEGMKFSGKSGWLSTPDRFKVFYKTCDTDILVGGVGVALGDPDGLYHALGKNGAILSPMVYRERVGELLEEGRILLDHSKLHDHYQKVSRAILEEVPFVHIGFAYGNIAYRKDIIEVELATRNRNADGIHLFKLR